MDKRNDFRKYATGHLGMNGLALDQYAQITDNYFTFHPRGAST